ncbi:YopX family protein [Clostridium perfringens]|uniref:YopX family protein n=1 Tax=Clostridium perfringens TaxID=1502 RepID=UPI0028E0A654|nr:YopX family protein [Clostridium perfringens]MDT9336947.1 YopX family protein [Clostridium perfringens]MDT9344703.1 YopX family protein [Clostridium perfringens]MDT9347946.1 YopX family protein [Clostridium perfringens]MDT9353590.1 YopX family protein [Clostridium perfringens]
MNRDIKFRAWDEELGEMLYTESEEWFDDGVYFRFNKHEDELRHELMRYTGLKDKNGKEIYEKDIVKVNINNKTFNAWIVFEMGSFMIANDDITYYIDDNWNDNVKCLSELAWEQEEFEDRIYCLEVIGDTYQNIDLIEV